MDILVGAHTGHDSSFCYLHKNRVCYVKLERLLEIKHFGGRGSAPVKKHHILQYIKNFIFKKYGNETIFFENQSHHELHYLSVDIMENLAIDVHIVIDGIGDDEDAWCSVYRNHNLIDRKLISQTGLGFGHGAYFLGTDLGIKGHTLDIAGKFMGLQSYGKFDEKHYNEICKKFDMNFLGIAKYEKEYWRQANDSHLYHIDKNLSFDKKINIAHTVHHVMGQLILKYFEKHAKPNERIGYSGGVAQNVVWNTLLKKKYPNLIIYPHCADDGISLGLLEKYRLSNSISKFHIHNYPFMQEDESSDRQPTLDTIYKTAKFLSQGKIVAWYQGNGEIGPRALGNRSILMDPRIANGKDIINRVKNRELYRPFGASVLSEYAKEYFDLDFENPYMLYLGTTQKSNLRSITHIDGTCRAQTVLPNSGIFRSLLECFFEITGCPVLLNTSLNKAGKPLASKIQNTMNEFISKPIDVLVVGNDILIK